MRVRIHGGEEGAGLWLHGWLGDGGDGAPLAAALGRGLVCPDLPGHGETPLDDWTLSRVLERIAELAEGRPWAGGYSMGGRLLMMSAAAHPEAFHTLVLESAFWGYEEAEERAARLETDGARAEDLRSRGLEAFCRDWYAAPMWGWEDLGTGKFEERKMLGQENLGTGRFGDRKTCAPEAHFGTGKFEERKMLGQENFGTGRFEDRKMLGQENLGTGRFEDRKTCAPEAHFGTGKFEERKILGQENLGTGRFGEGRCGDRMGMIPERTGDPEELAGALLRFSSGRQPDLRGWLRSTRCRILWLAGRRDRAYAERADWVRSHTRHRVALLDTGHAVHRQDPNGWAVAVRDFLEPPNSQQEQ